MAGSAALELLELVEHSLDVVAVFVGSEAMRRYSMR